MRIQWVGLAVSAGGVFVCLPAVNQRFHKAIEE